MWLLRLLLLHSDLVVAVARAMGAGAPKEALKEAIKRAQIEAADEAMRKALEE